MSQLNSNILKEDNIDRTILGMASLDLSTAIVSMQSMETVSKIYIKYLNYKLKFYFSNLHLILLYYSVS